MNVKTVANINSVLSKINRLPSDLKDKVAKYAISDLTRKVGKDVTDTLVMVFNIKKSKLDMKTKVSNGVGTISANMRQRNLEAFNGTKQIFGRGGGIKFEYKRGEKDFLPHAFFATGRNGNRLVFIRNSGNRKDISSVYKVSFGGILKSKWMERVIDMSVASNSNDIFERKLQSYLKVYNSRGSK